MKRNNKKQNLTIDAPVEKRGDYGFVNLSTYTSPEIKEVPNKEWIQYGEDNNYFQFLIDRYNGSPTNNAAINGISQSIYGKGLSATDANRKPDQYAQMVSLLHKDCVRKLCYDLKLMGQAAIQVIYSKDRKKIAQLEHFPIETLRAEKANEEGEVPAYYYFKDWVNIKPSDKPLRIPAYGMSKENIEIYYIKPYRAGFYYYSPVDYQGGIQYAELEEEISNFHLNNLLNGLSPSMLVNFNNGIPPQQERELIEQRIVSKFSGTSNSGRFILAFNDSKENQAEITPVQLSDAHNQYQFLSDESAKKVMVAHRIVSPFLLGIRDGNGFSSNADEIKNSSILMDNTVIRPFQELLIDCFDQLLSYNGISLNLYFITLQPLEFTEVDPLIQDKETIEEETGVQMEGVNLKAYPWDKCIKEQTARYGATAAPKICGWIKQNMSITLKEIDGYPAFETIEEAESLADAIGCEGHHVHTEGDKTWYMPCENHDEVEEATELSDEMGEAILKDLSGEIVSDEWELVDEREEGATETTEDWASKLIKPKKSLLRKLADQIDPRTEKSKKKGSDVFSVLDKGLYKIRYKYFKKSNKKMKDNNKSRIFCENMMKLSDKGIIYRIEEIDRASREGVNKQLGHKRKAYNLFRFKGGIYCRHAWKEQLYRLKKGTEQTDKLADYKKTSTIPSKFRPSPRGLKDAKKAPVNMPNQGAYPT